MAPGLRAKILQCQRQRGKKPERERRRHEQSETRRQPTGPVSFLLSHSVCEIWALSPPTYGARIQNEWKIRKHRAISWLLHYGPSFTSWVPDCTGVNISFTLHAVVQFSFESQRSACCKRLQEIGWLIPFLQASCLRSCCSLVITGTSNYLVAS